MNEEKRLLIVDDEEAILYAYQRLFGYPRTELIVDTAANLEEAKAKLKQHKYKVVVTDLRLGIDDNLGGFNLVGMIKAVEPSIKIVMVTAYGSAAVKKHAMACGADYYLEKPVQLDQLRAILTHIG